MSGEDMKAYEAGLMEILNREDRNYLHAERFCDVVEYIRSVDDEDARRELSRLFHAQLVLPLIPRNIREERR